MISANERAIYESMQIPLVMYADVNGDIHAELASDGLCQTMGASREAILAQLNQNLFLLVHPDDEAWMRRAVDNFFHRLSDFDVIFRNRRGNAEGDYRMVHGVGKWQRLEDGSQAALLTYYEMVDTEGKLGRLFSYEDRDRSEILFKDPVTGLPNLGYLRQFANERMQILRACDKTPVLMYCDVRSLHNYNFHYGYTRGDELMRIIAQLLGQRFPEAMLCRGADDHFILIDAFTDEAAIAEILAAVNRDVRARAYGVTSGLHAGICRAERGVDASSAVDRARQALKELGDDMNTECRFYAYEKDETYWKERYIVENLDKAIEKGWIKPFYQSILRTQTEKYTILEALARWIDPAIGMISPAEFIPVLSRFHLLHRLDLHMAEQVCREFGVRREAGLPLIPVTVNFSAQDFDYVDVVDRLNGILDRHGVSRDSIIVEITEQDAATGTEHFREELRRIRESGYKLWIDDFGSGYSSLNVFSQFDVDRVKFDLELLRHLDDNHGANRRILKALVNVCREMGVHTLAEGVETAEQLAFLKEIGCEMVQGFYFHKPESVESSVLKFRRGGPVLPHESPQERARSCEAWLGKVE